MTRDLTAINTRLAVHMLHDVGMKESEIIATMGQLKPLVRMDGASYWDSVDVSLAATRFRTSHCEPTT